MHTHSLGDKAPGSAGLLLILGMCTHGSRLKCQAVGLRAMLDGLNMTDSLLACLLTVVIRDERRKDVSPPDWSKWPGQPSREDPCWSAACAASTVESSSSGKGTVVNLSGSHAPAVLGKRVERQPSVS